MHFLDVNPFSRFWDSIKMYETELHRIFHSICYINGLYVKHNDLHILFLYDVDII